MHRERERAVGATLLLTAHTLGGRYGHAAVTVSPMTTPCTADVNVCLLHPRTNQPHPPSLLRTEQCHRNVTQHPAAPAGNPSFVPAPDTDPSLHVKPAAELSLYPGKRSLENQQTTFQLMSPYTANLILHVPSFIYLFFCLWVRFFCISLFSFFNLTNSICYTPKYYPINLILQRQKSYLYYCILKKLNTNLIFHHWFKKLNIYSKLGLF